MSRRALMGPARSGDLRAARAIAGAFGVASLGALSLAACGGASSGPPRPEDFLRVGVEVEPEAASVEATLVAAGFVRTERVEGEGYVALGLAHPDGRRAVRVVTSRGMVAALDSHEPDGLIVRHGNVALRALDPDDLDRDGRPEVVVAREEEGHACLALLRIAEDGSAALVPTDAEALAPGACVEALEDLDGDGALEGLVLLAWPELAIGGAIPTVTAVLVAEGGGLRARGVPAAYLDREREARLAMIEAARRALDVGTVLRAAVELAALAHLDGAVMAAVVRRFDELLSGLVLDAEQLEVVRRARAFIAAGWRSEGARDTPAPRADGR